MAVTKKQMDAAQERYDAMLPSDDVEEDVEEDDNACVSSDGKELNKLRRLEFLSREMGVAIELLHMGSELGYDPKKLVDDFVETYHRVQPALGEFWGLSMHEVMVMNRVRMVINALGKVPTFTCSELDKRLYDLLKEYNEYRELEIKLIGF